LHAALACLVPSLLHSIFLLNPLSLRIVQGTVHLFPHPGPGSSKDPERTPFPFPTHPFHPGRVQIMLGNPLIPHPQAVGVVGDALKCTLFFSPPFVEPLVSRRLFLPRIIALHSHPGSLTARSSFPYSLFFSYHEIL